MRKAYLTITLLLMGGFVFYFLSNYSRSTGQAHMVYPNKTQKKTQIQVWGPAGYHYIDIAISTKFEDKSSTISGKGLVEFSTFGGTRWRNNYMHYNDLDLGKVNQMLERMELETPYLIWQRTFKKGRAPKRHYLMITANPELYNQDKKLLKLAQKAVEPPK